MTNYVCNHYIRNLDSYLRSLQSYADIKLPRGAHEAPKERAADAEDVGWFEATGSIHVRRMAISTSNSIVHFHFQLDK